MVPRGMNVDMEETGHTVDDDPGEIGPESRAAPRFTLLIRTAKLICAAGEYLCIIRDASASGASIRTFHPLPQGQFVLELPNGDRHAIERVWETEGAAGFRFPVPVDIDRLLNNKSRFPKRPVRLRLQLPALISCHGRTAGVVVHNLSQQGAQIESPLYLAIDQKLRLEADNLPLIQARVRWRKGSDYGLVFDDTFQFGELAKLAAQLQGHCTIEQGGWLPAMEGTNPPAG
ncbi:MAG: PilZ domain-containing protein [Candidatus Andeanibacterium colombiense]|uniref:PilZ domain-containing protein n=1 Tax=Candidatus Andeanibacterium colombiense TaxID=3121345 RepID=A0AAJ5X3W5_9SPHN|nr:MAG: PilZ domain-containing protein [Sphingomonadaceae bacterium]